MALSVFIIEEEMFSEKIVFFCKLLGFRACLIKNKEELFECLKNESNNHDDTSVVLLSSTTPDRDKWENWLRVLRSDNLNRQIFLMANSNLSMQDVVKSIKSGVNDILIKPFSKGILKNKIDENCLPISPYPIGNSDKVKKLVSHLHQAAKSDISVFLLGENGSGKETMARLLHKYSHGKNSGFFSVNCAVMSESFFQNSLFDAGRINTNISLFDIADETDYVTVFLDDVTELSQKLQILFLQWLEKVEGNPRISRCIRIISASSHCIEKEVRSGKFRSNLFYKLYVLPLVVPALRSRAEDIVVLAEYFLSEVSVNHNVAFTFTQAAIRAMQQWQWPGNITELKNTVYRAASVVKKKIIDEDDLMLPRGFSSFCADFNYLNDNLAARSLKDRIAKGKVWAEYIVLNEALKSEGWQRSELADALGMSTRALRYRLAKMKSMGLQL